MSESIKTFFAFFDTYDFTNTLSVSGYTLPFCDFKFKLRDTELNGVLSNTRVVWDLGDSTVVEAITAVHRYSQPGEYTVSCYLYNSGGESYYNTFTQKVNVYDFITTGIKFFEPLSTYTLTASQINVPITLHNFISWQSVKQDAIATIVPFCSGSDNNFFDSGVISKRYNHLYPYSSFYALETTNSATEFIEISSITPQYTTLYCKVSNNSIVYTDVNDTEGVFCGLSGTSTVFFKNDISQPRVNLLFGYETGSIYDYINTSTIGLSASITSNASADRLSINSCGITQEGNTTQVFPINKNKFNKTKISFVVKIKDSDNFTNKNLNINTALSSATIPSTYQFKFKLVSGNTPITNATFYSDSSIMPTLCGGIFKGYVITDIPTTRNVYISATLIDPALPATVSGVSDTFDIFTENHYSVAKFGEGMDLTAKFKQLAFQPLFTDTPLLFDEFLGSIFGTESTLPAESLGKKVYEKITNFVDNTATLDYSNIENLIGLCAQYGVDISKFGKSNYLYPSDIRRLVDLLSINFSRLRGEQNLVGYQFNDRGYIDNELYSTNRGAEVSLSYTVTGGNDLIAREKYSGKYKVLNSYLPLCAANITLLTSNTYKLSDYNDTWGWGLQLPANDVNINYYYDFYTYIPSLTGEIVDGIINYDDSQTTLTYNLSSYSDWSQENGIISNMLANQLYVGLDLFNK